MPARQSVGGGGPRKIKTPKASQPAKRLVGARQSTKDYGHGPARVYTAPKANPGITARATKRINNQVGTPVVRVSLRKKNADIIVKAGAKARFDKRNSPFQAIGVPGARRMSGRGRVSTRNDPYGTGTVTPSLKRNIRRNYREVGAVADLSGLKKSVKKAAVKVRAHELGHTLGLAHPGPGSDPYLGKAVARRKVKRGATGIMGSGNRLNSAEVKYLRTVAAMQRATRAKKRSSKGRAR